MQFLFIGFQNKIVAMVLVHTHIIKGPFIMYVFYQFNKIFSCVIEDPKEEGPVEEAKMKGHEFGDVTVISALSCNTVDMGNKKTR